MSVVEDKLAPWMKEDALVEPWSLKVGAPFKDRVKDLGAGALVAATFIGSGDVATGGTAGGYFGLGYWWAYWVTCAAAWVAMDISARHWLARKKPGVWMFTDIHWILGIFLAVFAVYFGVGNVNSQIGVAGQALTGLFPGLSWDVANIIVALAAMGLVWFGSYNITEKLFFWLLIMIVASFYAALVATGVSLADAARGLLPAVDSAGKFNSIFQAIAGTNINGAAVLLFSYTMMEKNQWHDSLTERAKILTQSRANNILGSFGAAVTALAILGVINQVIYPHGIIPRKVEDFASLIEPVAGSWSIYVFSLGLFAASFSTAIGNGMLAAYILTDYFKVSTEAKGLPFRVVYVGNALIATALLVMRIDPIFLKTITSAMNAMFFGVVGLVLFYWSFSSRLGYFRNGKNLWLWGLSLLMLAIALHVGVFNIFAMFGIKF
ncbi:MAG: divalent metal cation transporter [Firmicutes bacterium]|nr:divalent metal cation transporter [Bacillota bacterium]